MLTWNSNGGVLALQELTRVKFLTDGVLLREMMDDPLLSKYRYCLCLGRVRLPPFLFSSSCSTTFILLFTPSFLTFELHEIQVSIISMFIGILYLVEMTNFF